MDWIEQQLANAPRPIAIAHLGSGLCSELDIYLRYNPRHICLVEPSPEILPELRRRTANHDSVIILPVAVSSREGRQTLKLFNYADLTSLRKPTGLMELLPGLTQIGQAVIDVIAAQTLPALLDLDSDENNWLVIDTPGEEFAIIESLAKQEQLHHFDRIVLNAGAESLYEGARSAEDVTNHLQGLGYFVEGVPDSTDVDWPRMHFRLNPKALECRALKRDNQKLQRQLEHAHHYVSQLKEDLEAEKQERDALSQKLEQVEQSNSEEVARLKGELGSTQEQLESARQNLSDMEAGEANNSRELEALSKSNERIQVELEAARAEAEKQRNDLGIALRLQALREADLKELQERFGELQNVKSQQQELLGKLHQRLSVAADYLRLESDGANSDHVREELARALSGEHEESK